MITAAMIDSREPDWVQHLTFGNVLTSVMALDYGDVHALTDDDCILVIERKKPEDFLNSLHDERLLPQLSRMVEARVFEQVNSHMMTWPYLVITGELRNVHGYVATDERGPTKWDWNAVQGALLTIQEMGCFVVMCNSDADFEACIMRLANRKRDPELKLLPPRPPVILGPASAFLASLPGVGIERTKELMDWSANSPAHALAGITDMEIPAPIPTAVRNKIRAMLGLRDRQILDLWINSIGDETLKVLEKVEA